MANTLTNLIPTIYAALDEISRELVGAIPACTINSDRVATERLAKDQTVRFPIVPAATAYDITPGLDAPDSGDAVIGNDTLSISESRMVPIRFTGNEQKGLKSGGQYDKIMQDRIAQALRTLVNEIEEDLCIAGYQGASRAYGTAGTTPFASDLSAASNVRKILADNGCPMTGNSLVVNTAAGVNLRNLANLSSVYAAGTDATLRQGTLLPLFNLDIKESAQVQSHTKGTATGMDCTAIEPVGETTIAVDGSDSGTILIGDVITRGNEGGSAADANKYVVLSSTASGAASGNIVINKPGVRLATAVADEWTIGDSYTANFAFNKNALHLITGLPEMPEEGDMANDRMTVVDPLTGIAFEFCVYKQYKQIHYEVGLSWGVKASKPEWIALLLG